MNKAFIIFVMGTASACSREPPAQSSQDVKLPAEHSPVATPSLGLAAPMERALSQYAPGFVRFAPREYAANAGTHTVSRAEADFNGDSLPDVALYGHDETREILFVLLSVSDSVYRVYPISETRLEPFPNGVSISIGVRPAGPLQLPELLYEADTPKSLKYPALEVTFGQEASEMFYWNGSRLVKQLTGD